MLQYQFYIETFVYIYFLIRIILPYQMILDKKIEIVFDLFSLCLEQYFK